MLNLVWIGALLAGGPLLGLSLEGFSLFLAVAVLLGGGLQVAVQLPALKRERLLVRPRLAPRAAGVGAVLLGIVPVAAGQAVFQVNALLDQVIAAALIPVEGANTWFFLANRLFQFPLALVGTSLAVASLPGMARLGARGERAGVRSLLDLPCGWGFSFRCRPLWACFSWRGRWWSSSSSMGGSRPADSEQTSAALACLSAGLPFVCLTQVATRVHQALGDLKSPVRLGCRLVGLNLGLNLLLVGPFGVAGLAAATSLTSALLAVSAASPGSQARTSCGLRAGGVSLARQGVLVAAMALVLGAFHLFGSDWGAAVRLAVGVVGGGGFYLGLAWLLKSPELGVLLGRFRNR